MNTPKMIGNNIKELMNDASISTRKMAEIINVTHPTMSKYLNGIQVIDSEKLMIVANYFNKDFDYFFAEEHNSLPIMFRAEKPSKNIEDSNYHYILTRIKEYSSIIDDKVKFIPQRYALSIADKLTKENEAIIEQITLEQRRSLNVENHIPANYFNTLSKAGVNVLCYDLENPNIFGASSYSDELGSFIFINANREISQERQEFSLIHELGHLLFHRNEYLDPKYDPYYNTTRGDIREKVANTFAGYFLLPRDLVINYIKEMEARDEEVSIIKMKKYFRVSIQPLYLMLHKYELITREAYTNFWRMVNIKGYATKEPKPLDHLSFEKGNQKLLNKIKDLYFSDDISINKIADVLDKDIIDIRKIVKSWSTEDEEFKITL